MIIVTSNQIEGKNIVEVLGLVRGNAVRARVIGKDIIAGFKAIVGGEITEFTQLLVQSREQATKRMVERAEELGQMQLLLRGILPLQLWAVLLKY